MNCSIDNLINKARKEIQAVKSFYVFPLLLTALVASTFFSCNSTKTKIDEEYRSGVVLIMNQYYYTLTFPGGAVFYLEDDGEGNIVDFEVDPDSAGHCINATSGTGFFISKDGKIATNKHVASRTVSNNAVTKFMKQNLKQFSLQLEEDIDQYENIKNQCQINYNRSTDAVERAQIAQLYSALEDKIKENKEFIRLLNYIDPEDGKVEYHSELKVAYNGTFLNSVDEMYPCSLRDTSDFDVAIIQLNSKQTPPDRHIFTVPENNMLEHYSFGEYITRLLGSDKNDELYMIGFNYGIGMAITNEGIYSQCTEGTVSRNEKDRIMYTISTIPGSSGSPVLNRRGQLVAINYAGVRGTQGFNYGVKEKYLHDLLNND